MSDNYGVNSFHVSVQAGDSAAHLLLQFSGKTPDGNDIDPNKPYVLSAVLIDGGDNVRDAPDTVLQVIQGLSTLYDFKNTLNTAGVTKFNSVIVTHWDEDHHEGLAKVIMLDVMKTLGGDPDKDADDIQVSFMYYGDPNNRGNPLTTLYAPLWETVNPKAKSRKFKVQGAPTGRWGRTVASTGGEYIDVKFWKTKRPRSDIDGLPHIAKLDYTGLLGMDFFQGKKLLDTTDLTTPAKLLLKHKLASPPSPWPDAPGMYCLAAYGQTLPVPASASAADRPLLGVVNDHDSATNASSIAAAIIWPGTTPRVSNYFAGDSEFETEQRAVKWVGKTKVKHVKASHHGSATSFPVEMFENWQPDNIIISAGSSNGHPRWEFLLYFYYDMLIRSAKSDGTDIPKLHPTCYPYWFGKNTNKEYVIPVSVNKKKVTKSRISTDAFDSSAQMDKDYRTALAAKADVLKATGAFWVPMVYDTYRTMPDDWRVRVRYLSQVCCEHMWRRLSDVTPNYYPTSSHAASCCYFGPMSMATVPQSRVFFVFVAARSEPKKDEVFAYDWSGIPIRPKGSAASKKTVDAKWSAYSIGSLMSSSGPSAADTVVFIANTVDGCLIEEDEDEDEGEAGGWTLFGASSSLLAAEGAPTAPLVLAAGPKRPLPADGFFYCSSSTYQPGPRAAGLSGLLDTFVAALHTGWIGVTAAPASATDEVAVLATDELYMWLDAVFGLQNFTVQGDTSTITGMSIGISFAGYQLQFSTEATPWVFGLPQAVVPTIPPTGSAPGLYSDDMLILGLAGVTGTMTTTTLQSLCDSLAIPLPGFLAAGAATIVLSLTALGEEGHRNALWFMPTMDYQGTLRLAFNINGINPSVGTDPFSKLFAALGLTVHSAMIIANKSGTFSTVDSGAVAVQGVSKLAFTTEIALGTGGTTSATIDAALVYDFADDTMRIVVSCNPADILTPYLQWIQQKLGISVDIAKYLKASWVPTPRRVTLNLAADHSLQRMEIDFELDAPWGQGVVFLFTFYWTPAEQRLGANLWPGPPTTSWLPAGMTPNMLTGYEDYEVLRPLAANAAKTVQLLDLLPGNLSQGDLKLPSCINPDVYALNLSLTRTVIPGTTNDQVTAEFYASLTTNPPTQPAGSILPQIVLSALGLDLKYVIDRSNSSSASTFSLGLDFKIGIYARDSADCMNAVLGGSIAYTRSGSDSSWQIGAYVNDLKVANLIDFFETESKNGVMDLIEDIVIQTLELTYDYDSKGDGSHFVFDGILMLGIMEFDLTFEHWTDHWSFAAHLKVPDTTATVNSILGQLTPDVVLPSFIGNITLLDNNSAISLEVWKQELEINDAKVPYIVFKTDIVLGEFSMTFIQYNTAGWKGPKRIFRAALSGPLDIGHIPVVESLTQPFDDLYFLYVQDASGQSQTQPGILRQEIPLLNDKLDAGEPTFIWKETHKPKADGTYTDTDTVIQTWLRFSIVATLNNQPTVVLDHSFGSTPSTEANEEAMAVQLFANADSTTSSDASMSTFHKTFGPLTISNIGIQFKDGHLLILLDAMFKLGPIDLALLGFGLDLDFTQAGTSLLHPPGAKGAISGLGFGFAQPPVTIAGLFERKATPDGSDFFLGGVVVTFEPYLFVAAGCYGILSDGSKTVALFCLLEGPLVELEFAEITGICGGFGYNTDLKFPTVDNVVTYPLVDHADLGTNPLDTIEKLLDPVTGCITAKKGSIWLAAGLDIDAFKLLNMNAVVAVEFSAADIKLGIFADVRASFPTPIPPGETGTVPSYVYVELGIVATVDFGAGTMVVEGQLAPTSYVLDPACHLTGGFALAYWFGSNPHAGDWVFTIGGYHPRFTPPSYYPNPPRLAISWSLDDSLSISGQAYFALTPKVAMGGGELKASLSLSPLYAYFDAYADFLVKFSPFYFMGEAGIDVGVRFTLDLWICTIHINIDIGAQLFIEGPPIHGYVHVDFWVFGFDIHFGDSGGAPDPPTLRDFYYLLKQAEASKSTGNVPAALTIALADAPSAAPDDEDTIDGAQQLSCVGGLLTSANQDQTTQQTDAWPVRAGAFQFSVTSPFAMDSATLTHGASTTGSGVPIYSRPMQNPNVIKSDMTITVTRVVNDAGGGSHSVTVSDFRIQKSISNVPVSMWKQYSADEDPLAAGSDGNYIGGLLDGTQGTLLEQMLSVTAIAPKPYWPQPTVEPLAAFNVSDASSKDVLPILPAAPLEGALTAWQAASPPDPDEWTRVPQCWTAPSLAPSETVAAWTQAMGWKASDLTADAPKNLVRDFEGYFMAVPQMTAVGA